MKKTKSSLIILILTAVVIITFVPTASLANRTSGPQTLPQVWQIVWADTASIDTYRELKVKGYDGLFKCVAYAPNYPNQPIWAGAEWRLVERLEGIYDWGSLRKCLDNALKANMWFIPEVVVNVPPEWFVRRFPDSLLKDSRGLTSTVKEGSPYLLSPWFISTGEADRYLLPFLSSFMKVINEYPNVPAIMIGNYKLNVLPWKLGNNDGDNFRYWPIWDRYAKDDYFLKFSKNPPSEWNDYLTMPENEKELFRSWLTSSIEENIRERYLPWTSSYDGWIVLNASIWDNDGTQGSIFTTMTPEMTTRKQEAIKSTGIERIIINDDNMGDCGLESFQNQDVQLAHQNGFLVYGERVPNTCSWANMFSMWEKIAPDGFINIGTSDNFWISKFRMFYGSVVEPFPFDLYLPLAVKD